MRLQAPPGVQDVLPASTPAWRKLEAAFHHHASLYGYNEIRTPTYEYTEVFTRTVGETSDIVSKEMFKVIDSGGRDLSLKPESTAPVMRAVIEHALCPPGTVGRFYYVSSKHFRMERQQKGRLKEHHQVGVELLGVEGPAGDAEVIELGVKFLQKLGLKQIQASINTLGGDECRANYSEAILNHFASWLADQATEVQDKVRKNPLRLLDNKDPKIRELADSMAPIKDYLEKESAERFDTLQKLLSDAGVPFVWDQRIVRGLDYYNHTVFECLNSDLGSQSAVLAGGRYDKLSKQMGGSHLPACGFGSGVERLLMSLEALGEKFSETAIETFLVYDVKGLEQVLRIARELRDADISCSLDLDGASFKSQMRKADKAGAKLVLIFGEDELANQKVSVKRMDTGEQTLVNQSELLGFVAKFLHP